MTGKDGSRRGSYTAVDEEYLQHSGLRGCRGCCLCSMLILLLLVALLNATVTAGLVYFLSITHEGMASLELFPGGKFLRVLSDVHLERLKLHNGLTTRAAMENETFTIAASQVSMGETNGSKLELIGNDTILTTGEFDLQTQKGQPLFSSNLPLNFDLYQVSNLHTSQMDAGSITSREGYLGLVIESIIGIEVSGMEGVNFESDGNVDALAVNGDLHIHSQESAILNGKEGIRLRPDLPVDGKGGQITVDSGQYKLCVCGTNGQVFAVPVTDKNSGCHRANEDVNPCLF